MTSDNPTPHPLDVHPLQHSLDDDQKAVEYFASNWPNFWEATQTAANAASILMTIAINMPTYEESDGVRIMLWQSVLKYQFQSLKAIVTGDLDIGYTLLRNAAELSRDIVCIRTNQDFRRWLTARKEKKRDKFFKFDETDPVQMFVYSVYKTASDLGTHGHYSGMAFGKAVERVGPNGSIAMIQMSDEAMISSLAFWLESFAPIQMLCVKQFLESYPNEFPEGWTLFIKWCDTADKFLKQLSNAKVEGG